MLYLEWAQQLRNDGRWYSADELPGYGVHHLLGQAYSDRDEDAYEAGPMLYNHPHWSQRLGLQPDAALLDPDAWSVLLALHYDANVGLRFYDAGSLTILIPTTDLAAGRYDRLICWAESA